LTAATLIGLIVAISCRSGSAANLTFNINPIPGGTANPFPPEGTSDFSYADVWAENGYVYVGSDRGIGNSSSRRGVSIFSITNAGVPTFLPPPTSPPPGYTATTYFGSEMEDVEVYDGIGYFGSDVITSGETRTGVDIVDLAIPFDPIRIGRVDGSINAHGKVHTLSVQRFNPGAPSEQRYLYTSDNDTSVVKITNVSSCMGDPSVTCNPQLVSSLPLPGVGSGVDVHEVVVRNNFLYAASKNPSSSSTEAWVHIYDVANPANPVLKKRFPSGNKTHTAMPTADGKKLIVAEERTNGDVKIYDIATLNPLDTTPPPLLATLNTSNVCHNGSCISSHSPHHVHVHGNLLFITWYNAGLQVFNIANVDATHPPVYVGAYDTWPSLDESDFDGNWGVDLSLGLNRVLLSDRKSGLIVVDASGVVLRGDYNQDMVVNNDDYLVWRNSFGSTGSSVHDPPLADGNFNGVVDTADYIVWRNNYGATGPASGLSVGETLVPEPASIVSLAIAVGLLSAYRIGAAR
jgi:hypothetical protein